MKRQSSFIMWNSGFHALLSRVPRWLYCWKIQFNWCQTFNLILMFLIFHWNSWKLKIDQMSNIVIYGPKFIGTLTSDFFLNWKLLSIYSTYFYILRIITLTATNWKCQWKIVKRSIKVLRKLFRLLNPPVNVVLTFSRLIKMAFH